MESGPQLGGLALQRIGWAAPALVALILGALPGPATAQGVARKLDASGDAAALNWRSWDRGLEEASRTGRPVLVDVYTDWCGWCRRMDRETYSEPGVRQYLSTHYVTVKLNPESSREARAVANRFRVTGYPTTVFLKPSGDHLVTVPGYVTAPPFLTLLRYVAEGHLERRVPFDTFRRQVEEGQP
jgi:uncharacterized protein YyaL (SSP411 family)